MEVELTESNPMRNRNTENRGISNNNSNNNSSNNNITSAFEEGVNITKKLFNESRRCRNCTYFCVAAWFITFLVMFICSFKYVSELQYCIRYHTITRAIDDTLYNNGLPGTYFLGIDKDFICYPRNRQRFVYTKSFDPKAKVDHDTDKFSRKYQSLEARSIEGLPMRMDVTVEYRLDGNRIVELFNLVGRDAVNPLQIVVFSALQNEASKHAATKFLGEKRGEVAKQMQIAANISLATQFYAEVLQVHLFHVDLPDQFEDIIQSIQNIRLDQQNKLELRKYSLLQEENKLLESKLLLEADAASKIIEMDKKIEEAKVQQTGSVTSGMTAAMILHEQVVKDRKIALVELQERLALAKSFRIGNVTQANNHKAASIIKFQTELMQTTANAEIIKINAAAKAIEIINHGKALAKSIEYKEEARLELYKALSTSANMTIDEIIQFDWIASSSKASKNNTVFIDYKKVPMQVENDEL